MGSRAVMVMYKMVEARQGSACIYIDAITIGAHFERRRLNR